MQRPDSHQGGRWAPSPDATVHVLSTDASGIRQVVRDGRSWPLGTSGDVEWIASATTVGRTITSAIPPIFDAYATIELPVGGVGQERRDDALLSVLRAHSTGAPWWLGYLDTGADDVVFPDAPRVILYEGWPYVLVQAGPEQAVGWRRVRRGTFWSGPLPNLLFPTDASWLVSTLWDDDWTCVGGAVALVENLLEHPDLASLARRVLPGEDATPPGHQAV
jgi:hypothetical protein